MNCTRAALVVVLATMLLSACDDVSTADDRFACAGDAHVASEVDTQPVSIAQDAGVWPTRVRTHGAARGQASSELSDAGSVAFCAGD